MMFSPLPRVSAAGVEWIGRADIVLVAVVQHLDATVCCKI